MTYSSRNDQRGWSQADPAAYGVSGKCPKTDANRKLPESFETRSREAKEFGRVDTDNLHIVSMARAPEHQGLASKVAIFDGMGMFVGLSPGFARPRRERLALAPAWLLSAAMAAGVAIYFGLLAIFARRQASFLLAYPPGSPHGTERPAAR